MVVRLNNCQTLSNRPKKQAIWMLEWPNIKCSVEWFPIRNRITSATLWEEPQPRVWAKCPPRDHPMFGAYSIKFWKKSIQWPLLHPNYYASGKSCSCWVFSRCSQCTKTALLQLAYLMDASNFTSGIISWGQWRLPINHGDSSNYRKSSANLKWTSVLGTNPLGDILWKHTINIHKHYL